MEILQFLLGYFLKEYGGESFKPIADELYKNGFDLRKTFYSLSPEKIIPIIASFLSLQNKSPTETVEQEYNIEPINSFANEKILKFINVSLGA